MNFTSEQLSEHVFRIKDRFDVAMYLVVGDAKCMLIDTGYGVSGLKDYITSLCDLPLIVCLSHGHIDHALGAEDFDEVYLHPNDLECYKHHSDEKFRKEFMNIFFPNVSVDLIPTYKKEFLHLEDNMRFDLGNIHVRAILTPGHTFGTMMFLMEEDESIIFGDGCGPGTLLVEDFSTDISTYLQSLKKIKEIEYSYDRIYRFHGTCLSKKSLLDNVITCCENILSGKDKKIAIPFQEGFQLLNPDNLSMYMANDVESVEGNITYREDKVK